MKVPRHYRYVVAGWDCHGNQRVYLRRRGQPEVRLREEPGTAALDAECRRALVGQIQPKRGRALPADDRLRALCVAYFGSAGQKRMAPRSRYVQRLILDRLCDQYGEKPADLMQARHVCQIRDSRTDTSDAANSIIRALRAVYRHGVLAGLAALNPAREVEYLHSGSNGYDAWTDDEVAQFEACHAVDSRARLALALLLYTGQRRSDVLQLGRQHLKDGWLSFVQIQNRRRKPMRLSIPMSPELQPHHIAATPSAGAMTFLASDRGTPDTPTSFGRFRRRRPQAGLSHYSAHGLRMAAVSRLAEPGASVCEIVGGNRASFAQGDAALHQGGGSKAACCRRPGALSAKTSTTEKSDFGATILRWDETEAQALDDKGAAPVVMPGVGIDGQKIRRVLAIADYGYLVLLRLGLGWTRTVCALTDQVLARCRMLAREVICHSAVHG
jgi:integrase